MTSARRSVLSARALVLSAAVVLGGSLVAGCGSSSSGGSAASTTGSTASTAAAALTVVDPWVKAQPQNMTGFFGVLTNNSDKDITIVDGSSDVATMVETHEMAMIDGQMKMRKKEGGFIVPAHGTHVLKPGSDHIMLMGLKSPIVAGQSVTLKIKTADGQEFTATGVGKTIAGGQESYAPGTGSMAPGMQMGGSPSMSPSMSMSASS